MAPTNPQLQSRKNRTKQDEAPEAIETREPKKPSRIKQLIADFFTCVLLAILGLYILNKIVSGLEEASEPSEMLHNIKTDEFSSALLEEINSKKAEYDKIPQDEHPSVKFEWKVPDGPSAQEFLSSPEYLNSLKISSFVPIPMPPQSTGDKLGPSREDLRYINSRIEPQKVFPIWSDALENGAETFDIKVFVNDKPQFNINNPRNKRVKPNLQLNQVELIDDNIINTSMIFTIRKLKKLAQSLSNNLYFHIYLSKHGNLGEDYENFMYHKRIEVERPRVLKLDDNNDLFITRFFSLLILDIQQVIDHSKLNSRDKEYIEVDLKNRRDIQSGTISLFYPIVYINKWNFKPHKFQEVIYDDDKDVVSIEVEVKISESWPIFKYYIWINQWILLFISYIESWGSRYKFIRLFNQGLLEMSNVIYFLL